MAKYFIRSLRKDINKLVSLKDNILNILKTKLNYLADKNNRIFISLILLIFLFSDIHSHLYLKYESNDFFIKELNVQLINIFKNYKNIFF